MTQREYALAGQISAEMRAAAEQERTSVATLMTGLERGDIALVKNRRRSIKPLALGKGLRTKINVNLGTSARDPNREAELEKMRMAVSCQADAIMDLSTGGDLTAIRRAILAESPLALGTVPLYQAGHDAVKSGRRTDGLRADDILGVIRSQAEEGVDFMTLHCGITRETLTRYCRADRLAGIVSRGGGIILEWMAVNKRENPLYERYDDILDILREYDVTISLGDGMRPGCLKDATDRAQIGELLVIGELVERAWAKGVQAIVEGPGHVPLQEVAANMLLEKKICKNAPFYVLGPLVTDIAPGYDHITGAIGAALAGASGADFLCCVTPAEHLGLPGLADVKEGLMAFRIAAHAADIAKGIPGAVARDHAISSRRKALDWAGQFDLALDKEKCLRYHGEYAAHTGESCAMCGDFCPMKKETAAKTALDNFIEHP
ncbi:MAG: phosphomethylpyrimidine synthase ThiC [Spirochaetaceae bacterium]|jgi:phosphomethylpyrimidine synthase|nr:phosphomethylpyrimidine synthase ThiC [Spirochaetaceae bacterium]